MLACASLFGRTKAPPRDLSSEEITVYYAAVVEYISNQLLAPSTAHFGSIEETGFKARDSRVGGNVNVELRVDAQNAFGAMLRKTYYCTVRPNSKIVPILCFDR